MKNYYELFLCSSKELKKVRNLVIAGLLMSIGFVLHFFTIPITPVMRLSLGFLVDSLLGMLFGPVVAGMCGGISDIVNYMSMPTGPYFPGFTISGILGGIIYGIGLYDKKVTVIRCTIVTLIITVVVDIFLNTYWLYLLYSKGFFMLLPLRAVTNLMMIPIRVAMMYFFLSLIRRLPNI